MCWFATETWRGPQGKVPLLNDIIENLHHGHRLLLGKALCFKALDKLECVEMMVALTLNRRVKEGGALGNG